MALVRARPWTSRGGAVARHSKPHMSMPSVTPSQELLHGLTYTMRAIYCDTWHWEAREWNNAPQESGKTIALR